MIHREDLHEQTIRLSCVALILASSLTCWSDPSLPTLFSDHIVLQRGRPIHVWGKADAGEQISVELASGSSVVRTG